MLYGALEAGGTKMVCAIGNEKGEILHKTVIETETPEITMPKLIEWFGKHEIKAIGIASFGPLDLHQGSKTYGYITSTPKLEWQNYDITGTLKNESNFQISGVQMVDCRMDHWSFP